MSCGTIAEAHRIYAAQRIGENRLSLPYNRSRHEGYATMELHERANNIKTKQDLGQFVGALRADLATNPERWENPTLDRFREAMEAWIADMEGYYKNRGEV